MFNSTHTLVGLAIARAGLDEWAPRAALTAVIASNLPDIDIIADFSGLQSYLQHHRGFTHSLLGIPLLSIGLAGGMFIFTKDFWKTLVVAFLAMATHPVLDYSNAYGLRPFLPFDGSWYYGDALFIVDPVVDLLLLLGILSGKFFRKTVRTGALTAILLMLVYIGNRVSARNEAQAALETYTAGVSGFERAAVLPRFLEPWTWDGIVETKDSVFKITIDSQRGIGPETARMPKLESSPVMARAAAAPSAAALLGFARFPITRVRTLPSGYRVTFMDFRFYSESNRSSFTADVQLDRSLNVIKETMSFSEIVD
jgi:inner membrane protein